MELPAQPLSLEPFGAPIRIDADLVERAVLLAVERSPSEQRRRFHARRDPIYELDDEKQREQGFEALHAQWFDRLRLAEPLLELLAEQPSIARSVAACLLVPAARRKDEHADLRRPRTPGSDSGGPDAAAQFRPDRPVLVVHLVPASLAEPSELGGILRRELCTVADMLDPSFGYDPEIAVRETSGPLASLLRERHELLWRVSVDGRLAARGHLTAREGELLRSRFEAAFASQGPFWEGTFRELFAGPRPAHSELLRLARHLGGEAGVESDECPLCHMPTPRERLEREGLSARALAAAQRDFPDWRSADGMCPHCADLYDLRERARLTVSRSPAEGAPPRV